jgi:hypothetical protein
MADLREAVERYTDLQLNWLFQSGRNCCTASKSVRVRAKPAL